MDSDRSLTVLGRLEKIDFPEWDLFDIDAKIDTGAYTSSLHCHHIKAHTENDKEYVNFNLLDPSHEIYNEKLFKLPLYRKKKVKSSNGAIEERFVVKTNVVLYGRRIKAEFSLTDRTEMRYPVLVGRKLLHNRFLVDVSKEYLSANCK